MLKALYDYGVRQNLTQPPGFSGKTVKAYISLSDSFQQRNVILKISHDFKKQNALQCEKALHALSERDMIHLYRKVGTGSAFIAPGLLCCRRRGKM